MVSVSCAKTNPDGDRLGCLAETAAYAVELLRLLGKPEDAVGPVLLAVRNLGDCAADESLQVVGAFSEPGCDTPKRIGSICHRLLGDPVDESGGRRMHAALVSHLVSQLGTRRKPLEEAAVEGWDRFTKEPHPVWRIGYVRALADLEANPGGRCHALLKALESNDPSPEVRAAAAEALKAVAAVRGAWSSGSHKRMLLNAWWQIRKAQRIYLAQPVDDDAAHQACGCGKCGDRGTSGAPAARISVELSRAPRSTPRFSQPSLGFASRISLGSKNVTERPKKPSFR